MRKVTKFSYIKCRDRNQQMKTGGVGKVPEMGMLSKVDVGARVKEGE